MPPAGPQSEHHMVDANRSQQVVRDLVSVVMNALRLRTETSERPSDVASDNPGTAALADALQSAVARTAAWSHGAGTVDSNPRPRADQFVEPDVFLLPRKHTVEPPAALLRRPLLEAIPSGGAHAVLIGGAGSGKTTALKMIAVRALATGAYLPVIVRLRELDEHSFPVEAALSRLLAFDTALSLTTTGMGPVVRHPHPFLAYLDELGLIVLLDGLDEVASEKNRTAIVGDFHRMTAALRKTAIVLTSRPGSLSVTQSTAMVLELAPLSRAQVHAYAVRRLNSSDGADRFLEQVTASPYGDALTTPLLLEQLCAVYMRIGSIPGKPRSFYRKLVYLFLEEWDQQRSIKRSSHYAQFDVERKYEFLAHLAFSLTIKSLVTFGAHELLSSIKDIAQLHGLPTPDARVIAGEIESHTGLIVQTGQGRYSFAHRSIQEYLCAEYLVRSPSLRFLKTHLPHLPNELAITTALSSNSSEYLTRLTFDHIVHLPHRSQFASSFVARLILERPDLARSHDLELALFCLAILVDSFSTFADLNLPMAEFESARAAFKYYRLDLNASPPQLVAYTRHPLLALPFSLDLSKSMANQLTAVERLAAPSQ